MIRISPRFGAQVNLDYDQLKTPGKGMDRNAQTIVDFLDGLKRDDTFQRAQRAVPNNIGYICVSRVPETNKTFYLEIKDMQLGNFGRCVWFTPNMVADSESRKALTKTIVSTINAFNERLSR